MKMTHVFFGAKGGVGTSVVAASFAIVMGRQGKRVAIQDHAEHHDLAAVFGRQSWNPGEEVAPGVFVYDPQSDERYDLYVVDGGVLPHRTVSPLREHYHATGQAMWLVTRADYLALRRVVTSSHIPEIDGIVLVEEPGRSLGVSEVEDVLDLKVVSRIPVLPAVARAVDAGVLNVRAPEVLHRAATSISLAALDAQ